MNKIIVFQTDFGLDDGAISAMEGVSYQVSYDLNIRHLTHNIPQYNIFDGVIFFLFTTYHMNWFIVFYCYVSFILN